jgi:gluconolactonase
LLDKDAELTKVAGGFGFTEGPVWDERGFLYVSDEEQNKIYKVYLDGRKEEFISLGDPDGNAYDRNHRLIDCASVLRAIIAIAPDGKYSTLADKFEGKKFNSPNDVIAGPDGALYFTDPTLDLVKGETQEIPFQGVYRLDDKGSVRLLTKDLTQPNGLAFSPDGKRLYIDDSEQRNVRVYDVAADGSLANGRIFGEEPGGKHEGVPDGMRVDQAGNLYVTGPKGIWLWDPQGHHLGTIEMPEQPANLIWGGKNFDTLYITATTSVYALRTKAHGYVPYNQSKQDSATTKDINYSGDPDAEKRMTLLLKDWTPVSNLHLKVHEVPRAKFYVIDMHNHVDDAGGIHNEDIPPTDVVKTMDAANVKTIVILTGMWGDKLQSVLDKMVKPYPDRFVVFAQMDWSKIDDPNFSAEMVAQLDDAVKRGARGLKVLKDWGLGVKDKSGKFVAIDDPRMDPVWEECARLGIPVAIHSTDPEAFFTPTDAKNERYEELMHNPSWSFYGPGIPDKFKLLEQRNHIIAKHPKTIFIALHVANWPENLDVVSDWLRKYPNMYVEFGAREAELGRQPRRSAKFFNDFQDRIMFGTDSEPAPEMYANYFRWLETDDEYFHYWDYPGQGRWEIYGMALPDKILEKVYHRNAEKIFAMYRGVKP